MKSGAIKEAPEIDRTAGSTTSGGSLPILLVERPVFHGLGDVFGISLFTSAQVGDCAGYHPQGALVGVKLAPPNLC
jgi:hypothetical protein